MHGIQVGEKIVLNNDMKADRGPVVKVRAILPADSSGWYGVTQRQNKAWKNGEEFDCYLLDFSDSKTKYEGKLRGWMEFINPEDRKRWEEYQKKSAEVAKLKA